MSEKAVNVPHWLKSAAGSAAFNAYQELFPLSAFHAARVTAASESVILLVCGSTNWADERPIRLVIAGLPHGSKVVHGACGLNRGDPVDPARMRGADGIAHRVAIEFGYVLGKTLIACPAAWRVDDQYNRGAGYARNAEMLRDHRPTRVVACNLGTSGTESMMSMARRAGIEVIEVRA